MGGPGGGRPGADPLVGRTKNPSGTGLIDPEFVPGGCVEALLHVGKRDRMLERGTDNE